MNYTAYIQRQKNIIRRRHAGETFLLKDGEIFNITQRERLITELESIKGLNVAERAFWFLRRGA